MKNGILSHLITGSVSAAVAVMGMKYYMDEFYMPQIAATKIPVLQVHEQRLNKIEESKTTKFAVIDLGASLKNAHKDKQAEEADKNLMEFISSLTDDGSIVIEKRALLKLPANQKIHVYE